MDLPTCPGWPWIPDFLCFLRYLCVAGFGLSAFISQISVISGKKLICQDFPLCSSVSSVVPVLVFSFISFGCGSGALYYEVLLKILFFLANFLDLSQGKVLAVPIPRPVPAGRGFPTSSVSSATSVLQVFGLSAFISQISVISGKELICQDFPLFPPLPLCCRFLVYQCQSV